MDKNRKDMQEADLLHDFEIKSKMKGIKNCSSRW